MKLNITSKLILTIVVLVVLPVLTTGLMGDRAARQIVTRLLNESQISLAREIAEQADQLFRTAEADIQILSALPALSDFYYNRFYNLHSEAAISREQIKTFFQDVARKSDIYYRISYLNPQGLMIVTNDQPSNTTAEVVDNEIRNAIDPTETQPYQTSASSVVEIETDTRRLIRFSRPLFDVWNNLSGVVRLELDLDKISDRILARRVGKNGYAFVVDTDGRFQIHPDRKQMSATAEGLNDPISILGLVSRMLRDRQGMAAYTYQGNKVAAFTPVQANGWIVAVTLPESEFSEQVDIIGKQLLLIVVVAISISAGVGIFFSWRFVKPIKQLVQATHIISKGGLPSRLESGSHDELGILTRSFNHMVRNLRQVQAELIKSEKLVSLGRLATGVAHEIRNPLNDIKIATQFLSNKQPTIEEARELVQLISSEISHLDNFVTNFLSYARQPPLQLMDSDVNQLVADILHAIETKLEKHAIELKTEFFPHLPLVGMDPFQMERALMNIFTNAIEAMPEGGMLFVQTRLAQLEKNDIKPPHLLIRISDSGVGISAEQASRVFDPFYTTKDHGTGLGLSLSKSIVEAHGGTISVLCDNAIGVTFQLDLPARKASEGEVKSNAQAQITAGG